jgi:hypothetical protein
VPAKEGAAMSRGAGEEVPPPLGTRVGGGVEAGRDRPPVGADPGRREGESFGTARLG